MLRGNVILMDVRYLTAVFPTFLNSVTQHKPEREIRLRVVQNKGFRCGNYPCEKP